MFLLKKKNKIWGDVLLILFFFVKKKQRDFQLFFFKKKKSFPTFIWLDFFLLLIVYLTQMLLPRHILCDARKYCWFHEFRIKQRHLKLGSLTAREIYHVMLAAIYCHETKTTILIFEYNKHLVPAITLAYWATVNNQFAVLKHLINNRHILIEDFNTLPLITKQTQWFFRNETRIKIREYFS